MMRSSVSADFFLKTMLLDRGYVISTLLVLSFGMPLQGSRTSELFSHERDSIIRMSQV